MAVTNITVMTSSGMLIIFILCLVILIHCNQASIFDFEVIDGEGNTINLSKYQDKKAIIIGIINIKHYNVLIKTNF